jgi:WD40 repeat protein
VSFSNPPAGEPARFEIRNLVDQTTTSFQTDYINAGPAAWSPDGRYLIVNENWEDGTAWVVDPWSGSGEPIPGTERFLDGACFMSDRVVAHRTWNVGYGQGDAQPGVIRLTSLDTGSTVAEIGDDLFGDGLRCHPDGSISYLRRPVIEVGLSPDFTQLEPDYDAPVELIHIAPDGTTSTRASGDLRMV